MNKKIEELRKFLDSAGSGFKLQKSSVENLKSWLDADFLPGWAVDSLHELFSEGNFEELNDRFFRPLAFGTGGMRGRTIGKVSAPSELGKVSPQGTPQHAAVGANNMNDFTVTRVTLGLFNYCKKWLDSRGGGTPRLAVAYDVRHFSKHFGTLAASLWGTLGGEVFVFGGARSTPQLSFTVRRLKCTAGIVITASHNPAHDNGYKVYFEDGAQVVSPHAEAIVEEVSKIPWSEIGKFQNPGADKIKTVPPETERAYIESIEDCVIDKDVIAKNTPRVVFTPVHGTGAVLCPEVMRHFGLDPVLVDAQMVMDPRFPTVKQPNPEYAETLELGLKKMDECKADCLVATDPDSDRMGVAVRAADGAVRLLTGNMIGSLLADYRISRMKEKGVVTRPEKCALIKTFVTSPLQDAIAASHSVKCVNTLTGFKWIGGRLTMYENILSEAVGKPTDTLSYREKARLMQEYSTFFIFGGEESYGYLGTDSVRDKDANAAAVMFCEMLAYLKSNGKTVDGYLDEIYVRCGYHLEDLRNIYMEGASGAAKIQSFLSKLDSSPLKSAGNSKVSKSVNFSRGGIMDADGMEIPREKFFLYTLENNYKFAVRASGTEPKIKFYAFATEKASNPGELADAKARARRGIDALLDDLERQFAELTA